MVEIGLVVRWSMVALVVLQLSGCGKTEDSESGAEGVSDEGSKPLDDLSDAEVVDICEGFLGAYEGATAAYERGICVLESVSSTGDAGSCDAAVDVCIEDLEVFVTSVDECVEEVDFTGCEATLAELNECLAEERQRVERVASLRSCDDALRGDVSKETWLEDVPACKRLADRCPTAFEGEPGEIDEPDVSSPPSSGSTPHVIEGTVDGEAVEIRPGDSLSSSYGSAVDFWNASLGFGGASLWLWGDAETGQGLIQMPASNSEVPDWLCLDEVEVQRGTETSTWQSKSLSALSVACDGDTQLFELTFSFGYPAIGTLQGEAIEWVSNGFQCSSGSCSFGFQGDDSAWTGQDSWRLEVDTLIEEGATKEFGRAMLVHPSGTAAVACGGGGAVTWGTDGEIQIVVDALGPVAECPGTPIDGELSGVF